MDRAEWVEAAVLELVNDGTFYKKHEGQRHRIDQLTWAHNVAPRLSTELINCKPSDVCPDIKLGLLEYYNHTEPKKTQHKQEETKMSTKVIVKTFVGDVEASTMTDDQLFEAIRKEEQEIDSMEKIKNKPKKLLKQIEERKANIAELVKIVDSRD